MIVNFILNKPKVLLFCDDFDCFTDNIYFYKMSLKAKLPEFNFSASYMYSVDTKMYLLFSFFLLSLAYSQGNKFTNEIFNCLTGY